MNILDDESSAQFAAFCLWFPRALSACRRSLGWFVLIGFPWFFMGFAIFFCCSFIVEYGHVK